MTIVIGLTGGIASGKSTVSQMFRELQIPVIDADIIAREVVEQGKEAYKEIVEVFGEDVLQVDGKLDRQKLGSIVFHNEEKTIAVKQNCSSCCSERNECSEGYVHKRRSASGCVRYSASI